MAETHVSAALHTASTRRVETASQALAVASDETREHAEAVLADAEQQHAQAKEKERLARQREHDARAAVALAKMRAPVSTAAALKDTTPSWRTHTYIPLVGMTLANAVRVDEVYRTLNEIAALSPTEAAQRGLSAVMPAKVSGLMSALGAPECLAAEARRKVTNTLTLVDLALSEQQRADILASIGDIGEAVHTATAQGFDRFQRWFDSAQDRAQQWFAMNMRLATTVCAFIAAGALQLDAVEIYQRISTDDALREKLVKLAEPILEEGRAILTPTQSIEKEALEEFRKNHGEVQVTDPTEQSRGAYERAVAEALKTAPAEHRDKLLKEFSASIDRIAEARIAAARATMIRLRDKLEQTEFQLIPSGSRWPAPDSWWNHWLGMLFTAALLSLGAPFWFNALKKMSSLRPALARLVEEQPRQTPPRPGDPSATR
jgi:hypothetical protein